MASELHPSRQVSLSAAPALLPQLQIQGDDAHSTQRFEIVVRNTFVEVCDMHAEAERSSALRRSQSQDLLGASHSSLSTLLSPASTNHRTLSKDPSDLDIVEFESSACHTSQRREQSDKQAGKVVCLSLEKILWGTLPGTYLESGDSSDSSDDSDDDRATCRLVREELASRQKMMHTWRGH
jgi:hypothetical protein